MNNINFKNYNINYDTNEYISIIPKNNNEDNKSNKILTINKIINGDNIINELLQKNKNQIKNENNIYEDYKELKKEFNNFLENVLIGTTKIKNIIKKMDKQTHKKDKGFAEEKVVPKPIQLFFNLEQGTKMPRTKIGGLFQDYLRKNNLKGNIGEKNKIDKRIYKFDNSLSKLFGISEEQMLKINSCSSSKIKYPNGYNFHNYQTWIKKIYDEENNSDI